MKSKMSLTNLKSAVANCWCWTTWKVLREIQEPPTIRKRSFPLVIVLIEVYEYSISSDNLFYISFSPNRYRYLLTQLPAVLWIRTRIQIRKNHKVLAESVSEKNSDSDTFVDENFVGKIIGKTFARQEQNFYFKAFFLSHRFQDTYESNERPYFDPYPNPNLKKKKLWLVTPLFAKKWRFRIGTNRSG
jgi:hypothetical protein